jgi:hypothetical protein
MPPPAATQAAAWLWTQPTPPLLARHSYRLSVEITRMLWWQTRFTRGCVGEWKSGHNSETTQNRTHVYMNFFDHKDIGNHLLQLCSEVVKHSVYELLVLENHPFWVSQVGSWYEHRTCFLISEGWMGQKAERCSPFMKTSSYTDFNVYASPSSSSGMAWCKSPWGHQYLTQSVHMCTAAVNSV